MVSQCANPDCGAPFLYLREGKLFVVPRTGTSANHSKVEYFWLCGNCAAKLKITSSHDYEVLLTPGAQDQVEQLI